MKMLPDQDLDEGFKQNQRAATPQACPVRVWAWTLWTTVPMAEWRGGCRSSS